MPRPLVYLGRHLCLVGLALMGVPRRRLVVCAHDRRGKRWDIHAPAWEGQYADDIYRIRRELSDGTFRAPPPGWVVTPSPEE